MKGQVSLVRGLSTILLILFSVGSPCAYTVGDWTVTKLTDNLTNDNYPRVSEDTVVWTGVEIGEPIQVFMWRNGVTTQITDNLLGNTQPRIDGDLVAWTAGMNRIFIYDGEIQELTLDWQTHSFPEVSEGSVAWAGKESGSYTDIYLYNGVEVTPLTNTDHNMYDVRISGSTIVWWASTPTGINIFYYDGLETVELTDNTTQDKNPVVTDRGAGDFNLTWEAHDGVSWDIMHYDGTVTTNLTDTPSVDEMSHQSCGDRTVWRQYSGGQYSIWLHDGSGGIAISTSSGSLSNPQVSETLVTWWGTGGFGGDIFVYDGTEVTQLTDNGNLLDRDPMVDGGTVVWYGVDDDGDQEIFMARKTDTAVKSTSVGGVKALFR
jgi:hypothetical protein